MFGGIDLGPTPTKEKIEMHTARRYKDKWITSYDYETTESKEYKSKEIPEIKTQNKDFIMCSLYAQDLAEKMTYWKFEEMDEIGRAEITRWEKDGGYCIYLSVLYLSLLYETGVFSFDEMKLVQGYYRHPMHGMLANFIEQPPEQIGLHTWMHAGGAVIDFSIIQEECCFDFPGDPYIMGEIPEKMQLIGWEEGKDTIKKYARQIAKESNMTYYEWINYHRNNAAKVAREKMEEYAEEIKKKVYES